METGDIASAYRYLINAMPCRALYEPRFAAGVLIRRNIEDCGTNVPGVPYAACLPGREP